eukprot:TRINITY_DN6662_c0_g2_i1.p1 TRINITY_DN6662_c0_g2~~TRINITY_DN6662_c0_g2_i1.p1  ORF type:complete len:149 (+),score=24.18 TRINITY_DN6662_c0_g2_i1:657-1103(+)
MMNASNCPWSCCLHAEERNQRLTSFSAMDVLYNPSRCCNSHCGAAKHQNSVLPPGNVSDTIIHPEPPPSEHATRKFCCGVETEEALATDGQATTAKQPVAEASSCNPQLLTHRVCIACASMKPAAPCQSDQRQRIQQRTTSLEAVLLG